MSMSSNNTSPNNWTSFVNPSLRSSEFRERHKTQLLPAVSPESDVPKNRRLSVSKLDIETILTNHHKTEASIPKVKPMSQTQWTPINRKKSDSSNSVDSNRTSLSTSRSSDFEREKYDSLLTPPLPALPSPSSGENSNRGRDSERKGQASLQPNHSASPRVRNWCEKKRRDESHLSMSSNTVGQQHPIGFSRTLKKNQSCAAWTPLPIGDSPSLNQIIFWSVVGSSESSNLLPVERTTSASISSRSKRRKESSTSSNYSPTNLSPSPSLKEASVKRTITQITYPLPKKNKNKKLDYELQVTSQINEGILAKGYLEWILSKKKRVQCYVKIMEKILYMYVEETTSDHFHKIDLEKVNQVTSANKTQLKLCGETTFLFDSNNSSERDSWVAILKFIIKDKNVNISYGIRLFTSTENRMIDFLKNFNSITLMEMIHYINRGATILYELFHTSNKLPKATQGDIVSVMWTLYCKLAYYDELYTNGMLRIDDPKRRLYNYLKSCPHVYPRLSTHMVERLAEIYELHGSQKGLDLRGKNLPGGKQSLLFFALGDDTTMLKMEKAGCPPFWLPNFKSVDNIMEFCRHAKDYVKKKVLEINSMGIHRSEYPTQEVISGFRGALDLLYPQLQNRLPLSDYHRNSLNLKEKLFLFGLTFGVSTMIKIINDHKLPDPYNTSDLLISFLKDTQESMIEKTQSDLCFQQIEEQLKPLHDLKSKDLQKKYFGQRKGNEATLPSPKLWEEFLEKVEPGINEDYTINEDTEVLDINIPTEALLTAAEISEDSLSIEISTSNGRPSPEFKMANKNNSVIRSKTRIGQRVTDS